MTRRQNYTRTLILLHSLAVACSLWTMWLNWPFSQSSHLHEKNSYGFIIQVAEIWSQQGATGLQFLNKKCSYWQWVETELLIIFLWITKYFYFLLLIEASFLVFQNWSFLLEDILNIGPKFTMLFLYLTNIEEYYILADTNNICLFIINSTQGHVSASSLITYLSLPFSPPFLPFSLPTEKQYKLK